MNQPGRGLLIFDLDGTLFRTDICSVRALESVFRDRGLGAPPGDEWIGLFGRPGDRGGDEAKNRRGEESEGSSLLFAYRLFDWATEGRGAGGGRCRHLLRGGVAGGGVDSAVGFRLLNVVLRAPGGGPACRG